MFSRNVSFIFDSHLQENDKDYVIVHLLNVSIGVFVPLSSHIKMLN